MESKSTAFTSFATIGPTQGRRRTGFGSPPAPDVESGDTATFAALYAPAGDEFRYKSFARERAERQLMESWMSSLRGQAGVPAEGRTLSFHLAPQDAALPGASSGLGGGSAFAGSGASGDGSGARGFGEPGQGGQQTRGGVPWRDEDGAASGQAARWLTAALDITA